MIARLYFCEDCREEVIVYGDIDYADQFIEFEREHPEDHDISGPIGG